MVVEVQQNITQLTLYLEVTSKYNIFSYTLNNKIWLQATYFTVSEYHFFKLYF